ncbi:hypothetical protein ACTXT7_009455 [Hymenolepis weldensis]
MEEDSEQFYGDIGNDHFGYPGHVESVHHVPNIPEELINFSENANAGFMDCILNEPANFVGLTEKMDFYTIECFCGYAPTFGEMLDEFDL